MNAIAVSSPTRAEFVERISGLWHRSREYVLALGRALTDAKNTLPQGEFLGMIESDLPFGPRTAQRLMQIATDKRITDTTNLSYLPQTAHALHAVAQLSDEEFESAKASGELHPKATAEQVKAIAKPRELVHVEPRKPHELAQVITGQDDFLATFKGYRILHGMSQAEVDAASGRDGWNYTGKQEVGIRAMVNDECWTSMASAGIGMMLLPLVNFLWVHKCPCCGKENA
jgi:hypothetical protein